MANPDAAGLAQLAIKTKLITFAQLKECRDEVGATATDPSPLLRSLERKGYLTPWQSQKLLKGEVDGYFLGAYRLLYKVASGSFGRVFRADNPQTGTILAIKVLRRRWSDNPRNIELFEREGKVGLKLQHPNIVSILEVNKDKASKQYYIVMEFVEGGNLKDFLGIRKKLEPAEALQILENTASGLAYAYSQGVTHRDIKATNILISSQGVAKLVDFGLANVSSQTDEKVDRTVDYAGLETATNAKPGDVRSDIYFLGCVFYEMITGRPPFPRTRDKHVRMQKNRFDNVPPITADDVQAGPAVFRLVETMMAVSPQHRYQTPTQLLDAIRDARKEGSSQDSKPLGERSVFVVEDNQRLKEVFREKLKGMGFRVFLASDPAAAMSRFRQQPFDALIVDAGTVGEDGVLMFDEIFKLAQRQHLPCAGILVLSENQSTWTSKISPNANIAVFVRPITLKQLMLKLGELLKIS